MFAQPNQPRRATTDHGDANPAQQPSSQFLLEQVLSETLVRSQENSTHLSDALRHWRQENPAYPFDETLFAPLVRQVLAHRLGEQAKRLPDDLFAEVGRALWENEHSRQRVLRLWNSLETGP
ncbi:hypothetical protein NHH03_05075 [Stieleria sp. TO1_6]|uniref:hypothetical protein n=1 Tax=Stieleria tagensis TaxID=2956795 RepID=UPI00209ABF0A|nr:hypothetical protein [Stieleria tagensis]MCO8121101.1 hypothetical protein [Stieleria tagensis]